ncbi:MAG TPA: 1-(5-phosphoribosyl)-5-[(5-phosphoribosylamino)methylideneamino]imidazole-4-carboxamide isomerase [Thermodesulfobacteriota bacterium]|nr:1-(5-phosphoribosyl)-5-[(5-phosphoribosylamino)methylideneamino]imidazole-4-carboxamide isomerase [Thermodesulfobacteriota bacterium]
MLIIPAIDLKGGKCVRLLKGEEGTETVFSENPLETARKWEDSGARLIHVVDLDGAFSGEPRNFEIIRDIVNTVSTDVQIGGGIRNINTVEKYISVGVRRVILGTSAIQDRKFLIEVCDSFPERVGVGVDTKMGKIAVKGWKEVIDLHAEDFLKDLNSVGVSLVIHTDVDRDGTMRGVNLNAVDKFVKSSPIPVISSGGISSMEDIEKLSSLKEFGLVGIILGKSIYTGKIDLRKAIEKFS